MGARIQRQLCIPALHFVPLMETLCRAYPGDSVSIALTAEFAQAEKEVVAVVRAAAAASAWRVCHKTLGAFCADVPPATAPNPVRSGFTLLCVAPTTRVCPKLVALWRGRRGSSCSLGATSRCEQKRRDL